MILEDQLIVINRVSSEDKERAVYNKATDNMFKISEDRRLYLGKGVDMLNLVIMLPKQESRAKGSDTTVRRVLESRTGETKIAEMLTKQFTNKNSHRIRRLKLRIEIKDMMNNELLCSTLSGRISDSTSLRYGTLALYAFPLSVVKKGEERYSC